MDFRTARRLTAALVAVASLGLGACDEDNPVAPAPTPLGTPEITNVAVSGTSATVTYTPGANAASHRAELSAPGATTQTETATGGTVTFDGLTEGVTYSVQIVAIQGTDERRSAARTFEIEEAESPLAFVGSDILASTTWTADKTWVIQGPIFVGRDCGPNPAAPTSDCVAVTLTIEPGTTVLGDAEVQSGARGSYLVVTRGSRIIADANANRPDAEKTSRPNAEDVIVLTSSLPRGQRARGDWGGLIINGRAATNAGAESSGEGDSGLYGGTDDNDSSGILRGVRVEFAGDRVTATDELNGIAPQGVGAGTTMSYLQVHYNEDDGIEPFGGTVSVDHLVVTGIGDDSVDGTDGYRGFMQFVIAQQRGDNANHGAELSTSGDDPTGASPRSTAVIANYTFVGVGAQADEISGLGAVEGGPGVQFREGSNWRLYNGIIAGFGTRGMDLNGAQAEANATARVAGTTDPNQTLDFQGNVLWMNEAAYTGTAETALFTASGFNNMVADPAFQLLPASAFTVGTQSSPPSFVPAAMPDGYQAFVVTALNGGAGLVMPTDGRTLQPGNYAGAVEPGIALANAWYHGWTVWTTDGSDSRPGVSEL